MSKATTEKVIVTKMHCVPRVTNVLHSRPGRRYRWYRAAVLARKEAIEAAAGRKGKNGSRSGWSPVRAWVTFASETLEKELEFYSMDHEKLLKIL